jgi:uncharacterized protein YndB with AHSA1/START domain
VLRRSLLLALLAAAAPAQAFDLPPRAEALLARGRPFAEVRPGADGASGVVRAAIDIAAPRSVVWAVMTDCDLAPRMVANLKSCRVVDRDPAGRWDVREEVSKAAFLPAVRTIYREEFDAPGHMSFHRVGGDLKVLEGEWRLTPHGDGTRVTYEARAAAPFAVPGWIARLVLRLDLPNALNALRREAMARAAAQPSDHDG